MFDKLYFMKLSLACGYKSLKTLGVILINPYVQFNIYYLSLALDASKWTIKYEKISSFNFVADCEEIMWV